MSLYKNILLVEDEPSDQEFFMLALQAQDTTIKCEVANDGLHAVQVLSQLKPQPELIFLDINMPRMNGFEFLDWIKRQVDYRFIPVVILTTSLHDCERCEQLGAPVYFTKPYSFTLMKKIVGGIITHDVRMHGKALREFVASSK
jgi:CheY-like chemotaxis protein